MQYSHGPYVAIVPSIPQRVYPYHCLHNTTVFENRLRLQAALSDNAGRVNTPKTIAAVAVLGFWASFSPFANTYGKYRRIIQCTQFSPIRFDNSSIAMVNPSNGVNVICNGSSFRIYTAVTLPSGEGQWQEVSHRARFITSY